MPTPCFSYNGSIMLVNFKISKKMRQNFKGGFVIWFWLAYTLFGDNLTLKKIDITTIKIDFKIQGKLQMSKAGE